MPARGVRGVSFLVVLLAGATAACGGPAPTGGAGAPASAAPSPLPRPSPRVVDALAAAFARIAPAAGGEVGVAARHVESGEHASWHGDRRFPMASVYKVPIAVALLQRVDRGKVSLDEPVAIEVSDLRPGHSPLAKRTGGGGAHIAVRELLTLAVAESDNTASDRLLALAGGADAVREMLSGKRIAGIDVSRPEGQAILDYWGVDAAPPPEGWSPAIFRRLRADATPAERRAGAQRYATDPRDTATPEAMVALLSALQEGELLEPDTTTLLLDVMGQASTGPNRIRAGVPSGTRVAHKTGTGGDYRGVNAATNDAGLVTLPDGTHLALAVFVKSSPRPARERERAIADMARAAYGHWAME